MSESLCYDGYNQSAHTEVSMTLRSANGGGERNDACPKVVYGFNPVMSGVMMETKPAEETAQTLRKSPGGENGIVQSLGFKYKQSEKSQKPFAENGESQALSSGCHDSAVALGFKAGQSKDGGLGDEREVAPTLSHKPSALEPTVAQDNGIKCLNPQDQQTGRVYDPSGAMTSLQAGGGVSGQRRESVLMTDNLAAMRYIVRRVTPTECERLMGLPDGYTIPTGLRRFFDANGEPAPKLVAEFQRTFDTFGAIMADYAHAKPPKPKSAKQVADWLKKISDPATCPDSPRYRGCGNGWATNQPRWILLRLLQEDGIDPFTGDDINEKKD